MTIERRGTEPLQVRETFTAEMGRLVVTIDDLQVLRETVQRVAGLPAPPKVQFNGGEFDDSSDLKQLSDRELDHLSIKSGLVEIQLSPYGAVAIGDKTAADAIYRDWARARKEVDSAWREKWARYWQRVLISAAVLILIAGTYVLAFGRDPSKQPGEVDEQAALWFFASLVGSILLIVIAWNVNLPPKNAARIIPLTLSEYRADKSIRTRHQTTVRVAIASIVSGILGALIALLVKR